MHVCVRKVEVHGQPRWEVDIRTKLGRRRRFFGSKAAADAFASEQRREATANGETWQTMEPDERAALVNLAKKARAAGVSVWQVWEAFERSPETPGMDSPTLKEAVAEMVAAKFAAKKRKAYLDKLRWLLTPFLSGREKRHVHQVAAAEIEEYLGQFAGRAAETVHSIHGCLSVLFGFGVRRGWCKVNPCALIELPVIERVPPRILTPDEARKLIDHTREHYPRGLANLALGLFSGIRPQELDRIGWDAIRVDGDPPHVVVDAAASKVRQRRIVPLMPTAVAWVKAAKAGGADMPLPQVTRRRMYRSLRDVLGVATWPHDLLRHTAASYLLATHKDSARVAMDLGNSPAILFRHYRELVSPADADAFWGMLPTIAPPGTGEQSSTAHHAAGQGTRDSPCAGI